MRLPAPFGKYELIERIGTGGMAEVFLARSFGVAGFEKRLVLKRIRPEHARDPRFVSLFIHEAKVGVHLNHPNIVQVYELGKVGESWYIAMEHLHGRDLNKLVKALRADERRVPTPLAVEIVADMCRGLAYAHGTTRPEGEELGLVHRDVSPHNVFLTFTGQVKLVDFGIARLLGGDLPDTDDPDERLSGDADPDEGADAGPMPGGGKFAYMSPEQACGRAVDHRTDLYSAGVVLWELLVGHRLVRGQDPEDKLRRVREAVVPDPRSHGALADDALVAILDRALAREPDDRHESAAELEEDLRGWLYEHRARGGQRALAALMADTFPEAREPDPAALDVRRLADDLRRLDADARANASDTAPTSGSAHTSPGTPSGLAAPTVGRPREERRRVVVAVVDVDGFTAISRDAEPEVLFQRHLALLRWLRGIVGDHGGRVQTWHDDQVYVFFGLDKARTDDLSRAVSCVLELQRRVDELQDRDVPVQLAIGLHTGDVTVGPAGSRLRYMSRGDTTRLARRLSERADHGEVLASQGVYQALEADVDVDGGPRLAGRGSKEPVPSYRILGRVDAASPVHGPWIARGDELDIIRSALVRVGHGHGAAVLLTGDGGSGKTRLVRELLQVAARRRVPSLLGRATGFGHPLAALRELVLRVLDRDPDDRPGAEAVAALRPLGLFPRDLDALSALLADRQVVSVDAWTAVRRVLAALAEAGPRVVALEDVHHLPPSEQQHLDELLARLREAPVLFVLTGQGPALVALRTATHVHLGPFAGPQQRRLVLSLTGAFEAHPKLLGLVERTCVGNPLYIEELVKYLRDRGLIDAQGGVVRLTSDEEPDLPDSLASLLGARLDALEPAAKGALQLAAVMGETFDVGLLAEVIGLDDPLPLLQELKARGLVQPVDARETFAFSSRFVREAALRGLLGVQQRLHHRQIADALERRTPDAEGQAEVLARHCGEGGRFLDASRYAYTAGQRYQAEQHLDAAVACYRDGLRWLGQAPPTPDTYDARTQGEVLLRTRYGQVLLLSGELRQGVHQLRLALDQAGEASLPWLELGVHVALGRHHLEMGAPEVARAHLHTARDLARLERDTTAEVEVLEASAELAHATHQPEEALALWGDALERTDRPADRARILGGIANVHLREGDARKARPALDQALRHARAAGDRIQEGRLLNNLGLLHAWNDDTEEAVACFRRALRLREDVGYLRGAAINHHNIGDMHLLRGDHTRAYVAFRKSRDLAEDMGWSSGILLNDVYLAYLEGQRGADDVLPRLDALVARARRQDDHESALVGLWLGARLHLEAGQAEAARARLEQVRDQAHAHRLATLARHAERELARLG